MTRILSSCLATLLFVLACDAHRAPEPSAAEEPRARHITSAERVPAPDAVPGPNKTVMKLIKPGDGPVVGSDNPGFSGYAWTFYSDDGFDTGTSLELKTWDEANESERAILAGRVADDVVRVWDCQTKTKLGECTVSDYQILSLPRDR